MFEQAQNPGWWQRALPLRPMRSKSCTCSASYKTRKTKKKAIKTFTVVNPHLIINQIIVFLVILYHPNLVIACLQKSLMFIQVCMTLQNKTQSSRASSPKKHFQNPIASRHHRNHSSCKVGIMNVAFLGASNIPPQTTEPQSKSRKILEMALVQVRETPPHTLTHWIHHSQTPPNSTWSPMDRHHREHPFSLTLVLTKSRKTPATSPTSYSTSTGLAICCHGTSSSQPRWWDTMAC